MEGGPNTMSTHWQFSVAADGSIYFNSGDPGGLGAGDLYVSRFVGGRYTEPVNLGAPVNSEFSEDRPFIAPDESYLLFVRLDPPDGFRLRSDGRRKPSDRTGHRMVRPRFHGGDQAEEVRFIMFPDVFCED